MKLKLRQIVNAADIPVQNQLIPGSLSKLLKQELPIKMAYHLSKLGNKLNSELKQYELQRNNIIKKYGKDDGKGNISIDKSDAKNLDKYFKDHEELLDADVKIDFEPISLDQLGNVKLSPVDAGNLEWLFVDENDKKKIKK